MAQLFRTPGGHNLGPTIHASFMDLERQTLTRLGRKPTQKRLVDAGNLAMAQLGSDNPRRAQAYIDHIAQTIQKNPRISVMHALNPAGFFGGYYQDPFRDAPLPKPKPKPVTAAEPKAAEPTAAIPKQKLAQQTILSQPATQEPAPAPEPSPVSKLGEDKVSAIQEEKYGRRRRKGGTQHTDPDLLGALPDIMRRTLLGG
ncbi:DNA polymerase III subunit gamma/tau [uncultured Mediterranean phage uvDeep-CGR2-AD3-C191]|nr:DNA polymerase III subunit gamma/tau [uncultured Mediterranean phage uvDeep-CGR2-AD3-C191]